MPHGCGNNESTKCTSVKILSIPKSARNSLPIPTQQGEFFRQVFALIFLL